MDDLPSRVAVLEQIARGTEATLLRIETRFDRIEAKLDLFENRRTDDFKFLVKLHIGQFAALAAGFVLLLGVIARAQHWI
jgi:hypothetical protein